jgi:hypothetical protein
MELYFHYPTRVHGVALRRHRDNFMSSLSQSSDRCSQFRPKNIHFLCPILFLSVRKPQNDA